MDIQKILDKYPVYKKLYDNNVIEICGKVDNKTNYENQINTDDIKTGKTLCIGERCDCYFAIDLNKEELKQLSQIFSELSEALRGDND